MKFVLLIYGGQRMSFFEFNSYTMITRIIILTLIILSSHVQGQDPGKNFELGLTAVTVNSSIGRHFFSINYEPYEPRVTFINGIFLRYSHKKIGFRALCSYAKYEEVLFGYSSGILRYKNFKIGVGGQYYILKKTDWLYTFADAAYNNVYWSGSVFGDTPNDKYAYTSSINGFDFYLGFGLKLKAFKVINVSPELSFDFFRGQENNNRTSLITGRPVNSMNNLAGSHPVFKLHLNYIFY